MFELDVTVVSKMSENYIFCIGKFDLIKMNWFSKAHKNWLAFTLKTKHPQIGPFGAETVIFRVEK